MKKERCFPVERDVESLFKNCKIPLHGGGGGGGGLGGVDRGGHWSQSYLFGQNEQLFTLTFTPQFGQFIHNTHIYTHTQISES